MSYFDVPGMVRKMDVRDRGLWLNVRGSWFKVNRDQ